MKRDLLFVVERPATLLDERRLEIVARQRGIKKAKDSDSVGKLFTTYLRHAEKGTLSGLLVEITILHAATRQNAAQVLRDATTAYKVDVNAISLKVKQEFATKAIPPRPEKRLKDKSQFGGVKGRVKLGHWGGVKLDQCMAAKLLDLRGGRGSGA